MEKKKKIILISVIAIVILLIIAGIVWYLIGNNKNSDTTLYSNETSNINKIYDTLQTKENFSFKLTLDDNNYMYYAKSNNMAYTDTVYNGKQSKYIIKDGNSYLVDDETKASYTYLNNQTKLNMVINQLEEIKKLDYKKGKEKINGKNYYYEEYSGVTNFAMGDFTKDGQDVKTRIYYDGDEIVYMKTIEGEKQETLKVEISYDVNQSLFQIPENYKKY